MRKTFTRMALGLLAATSALLGASAQAQAPSWNGRYDDPPRGSYTQSCREITAFDGQVWARCQAGGGRWTWSSADVRGCRGGLENRGGYLMCTGNPGPGGPGGPGGGGGWPGGGGLRPDAVMFEHAGYQGQPYEVRGDMPDLTAIRFNDKASSIKILRGEWQVCEDVDYQGRCWILTRDEGLLGRDLNDRISSIRRVR